MLKITVKTDVPEALRRAARDIDERSAGLLQEIGTQLLSLARIDFEKKGRGGTGADGVAWKPLSPMTEYLKATRKINKGSRSTAERGGGLSDAERAKLVAKRRKLRATLMGSTGPHLAGSRKAKSAAIKKSQIGVDTGVMRNSFQPGFAAGDGQGEGNLFEINGNTVTVGVRREYADHFDKVRPIFPETLPPPWEQRIGKIIDDWVADLMKNVN